ncbi:MAG TPA: hypothetical protein VFX73_06000 [Chitinophagaceae bacterium]|nr:hypothetical protein [Chitinophagaceae bacterium]
MYIGIDQFTPLRIFFWRVTAAHVITYFLAGVVAYNFLGYEELFGSEPFSHFMKPIGSKAVAAGPALQLIRGLIISTVLWPFRSVFLESRYGWTYLWGLLFGLSILSTAAAAPGSVEGFIYTTIPPEKQLIGYFEVVPQTLAFSLIVFYWYKKPRRLWNILAVILVSLILLMSTMALLIPVR